MPRSPTAISKEKALGMNEHVARQGFELTGSRRRLTLPRPKTSVKEIAMKWKTPVIIEIAVGLEINAYACAE
jgi:coenzyme PQQ precursor peptide PqqA